MTSTPPVQQGVQNVGQGASEMDAPPPSPIQAAGPQPDKNSDYPQLGTDLGKLYDDKHPLWSNPDHRIELRWHQENSKAEATNLDVKRAIDANNIPTIIADKEKEKEYHDHIFEEIAKTQARLDQPLPIHKGLGLNIGDELAAGLGMLISHGRDRGQILEESFKNRKAANDNDYQNQMAQRQHSDQQLERQQQFQQQEAEASQRRSDYLDQYQLQVTDRLDAQKHTDLATAKKSLAEAKTKSGVLQAVKDIEELTKGPNGEITAVDPKLISEALQQASLSEDREKRIQSHEDYTQALGEYQATAKQVESYGGGGSPEELKALQDRVDALNKEGKYNFPPIRGGPTEKARQDQALLSFQKDKEKDEVAKWTRDANIKSREVTGQLANWDSERQFRLNEVALHKDALSIARLRAGNASGLQKAQDQAARFKMDYDQANQAIRDFKPDPADPKGSRKIKSELYAKAASLKSKMDDANNGVTVIKRQSEADEKDITGSSTQPEDWIGDIAKSGTPAGIKVPPGLKIIK